MSQRVFLRANAPVAITMVLVLLGTLRSAVGTTHTVDQVGFEFQPSNVIVAPGDTIEWIGSGGTHTVTSGAACTADGRFDLPLNAANPTASYTIPLAEPAGVIDYYCIPHCDIDMVGTITVEPPCPADANGDGFVNVLDLVDLLLCFGHPALPGCVGEDINEDGTVNVLDLIDLLLAFGTACP